MKPIANVVVIVLVVAVAAGAGYWWGVRKSTQSASMTPQSAAKADEKSSTTATRWASRHLAGPEESARRHGLHPRLRRRSALAPGDRATGRFSTTATRWGLPDTSPVPKKDPMGMDYIAGLRGRGAGSGGPAVKISARQGAEARRAHRSRGAARADRAPCARSATIAGRTSGGCIPSRPGSRAGSRSSTSTRPASRCAAASR